MAAASSALAGAGPALRTILRDARDADVQAIMNYGLDCSSRLAVLQGNPDEVEDIA